MVPTVSVIIPTWNKKDTCLGCIKCIYSSDYPSNSLEIIVVDNASIDGTEETISKVYPQVKIIKLEKNSGFGAAVNEGIKSARGEYIFISDNDVILNKDTLSQLVKVAEENKDFDVLGGKLYDGESGNKIQTFYGFINEENFHIERPGAGEIDNGQFDKLVFADTVSFGAALMRKTLFEKIGLLDEKYFIYFDDTDFMVRCKKAKIKVVFVPQAKMWHKGSVSLGKNNPRIVYYLYRNNLLIRNKFNKLKLSDHITNFKLFVEVFIQMVFLGGKRNECKAVIMATIDFYRGRFGEAPQL